MGLGRGWWVLQAWRGQDGGAAGVVVKSTGSGFEPWPCRLRSTGPSANNWTFLCLCIPIYILRTIRNVTNLTELMSRLSLLMYVMRLEWCLTPRKHLANMAYGSKKWQGLLTLVDGGRDAVFLEGDPRRSSWWAGPGNRRYPWSLSPASR